MADSHQQEGARLHRIRTRVAALAGSRICAVHDGSDVCIESEKDGARLIIGQLYAVASPDEEDVIGHCLADAEFLLALFDRAVAAVRALREKEDGRRVKDEGDSSLRPSSITHHTSPAPNFAAEAAMRCGDPEFQRWLMECRGMPETANAAGWLRSLLRIGSRGQLNSDARAAAGWKKLRGEFEQWKRLPRPVRYNGYRDAHATREGAAG